MTQPRSETGLWECHQITHPIPSAASILKSSVPSLAVADGGLSDVLFMTLLACGWQSLVLSRPYWQSLVLSRPY